MDRGQTIVDGRYRIRAESVSHPTGRMIPAQDTESGEEVLLKEIPVVLSSHFEHYFTEFKRRFHLLQSLRHPAITLPLSHVYDRSLDRHFLVFKSETGPSLRDYLKQQPQGRMPVTEVMELGQRIASALDYAHLQGVVCGGLLMDNVIMQADQQIRLSGCLDHELYTLLLRIETTIQADMTDYIQHHMVPEQWLLIRDQGGSRQVRPYYHHGQVRLLPARPTVESDIYALAALLYELLTGQPPFTMADLLSRLAAAGDQAGTAPAVTTVLGERGEQLLQQALAINPQQRPKRAGAWMRLLEGEVQMALLTRLTRTAPTAAVEREEVVVAPSQPEPQPQQPEEIPEFTVSPAEMMAPTQRVPPKSSQQRWLRSHRLLAASLAAVALTGVLGWKMFWPGVADEKSAAEMRDLVRSADRDRDAFQMTMNSGTYAYDKYREALRRDPGNNDARKGMTVVAEKYAQLAQVAIGNLADMAIHAPMAGGDAMIADELRRKQRELDEQHQRMAQLEARLREVEPKVARLGELEEKILVGQQEREQMAELTQRLQRTQEAMSRTAQVDHRKEARAIIPPATPAPGLRVEEGTKPVQEARVVAALPQTAPLPDQTAATAPPPVGSGYAIQVGAFGDARVASGVGQRLSAMTIVGSPKLAVFQQVADVRGQTYHRVRTGPFATRDEADRVMRALQQEGMVGMIIAPGAW
ncbi:MAG: SPOR domain-containing protein [Magnetococcales bacterium]|nr:SPOR domain-containing protein [Magnetococcales bacterium]